MNESVVVLAFKVPIIHSEGESANDLQGKNFLKLASQSLLKHVVKLSTQYLHPLDAFSAQESTQKRSFN